MQRDRDVEPRPLAGEVLAQLQARVGERAVVALPGQPRPDRLAAVLHVQAVQRVVFSDEQQLADRAVDSRVDHAIPQRC